MAKAQKIKLPNEWRRFADRCGADRFYWYVPKDRRSPLAPNPDERFRYWQEAAQLRFEFVTELARLEAA